MNNTSTTEKNATIGGTYPGVMPLDTKHPEGSEKWAEANFGYNSGTPGKNQVQSFKKIAVDAKAFAIALVKYVPAGAELTCALGKLREVVSIAKLGIQLDGRQFS